MAAQHGGRRLRRRPLLSLATVLVVVLLLAGPAVASVGDRLPEFKECVEVCKDENCGSGKPPTAIPLHLRLLLWTCSSECDHTCQGIVTARRAAASLPVVQFHGKWPFRRILGLQEPFSVLFSVLNLWAHLSGLRRVRLAVPASYPLRPYYEGLACVGICAWVLSAVFHARDFAATEQLDYFGAGAYVLCGLYFAAVRIFRLYDYPGSGYQSGGGAGNVGGARTTSWKPAALRAWTWACVALYACHVGYLKLVRWDYGYNMAANVAVGVVQNALWSWFSWASYRRSRRAWTVLPGVVVAWVMVAMSLELLDFPPWWGLLDAHSLWHLGTVGPTIVWYNFLLKDAQDDMAGSARLKS